MYDSEGSSYSANRVDYYKYKFSIEKDREAFYTALDEMYNYIVLTGVLSGELTLPNGMTLDDLDWNYIPLANFVLDQNVETQAMIAKIQAGLMSPQAAMLELGNTDPFETVMDQIAYAQQMMRDKGITVSLATPGSATTQDQPATEASTDTIAPIE
jgi:capsid protein